MGATLTTHPASNWPCLRIVSADSAILDVSVSPNAKKTEITGWHDGALRIRLAAPPVDGAANEALRKWLAKELNIPQSQITLLRGAASRRKQWSINAAPQQITAWLASQATLQN